MLIGVGEELWLLAQKLPVPQPDLPALEAKKHRQETRAVILVVVGVALELVVVPHSLKEVADLQAKNLALEAKLLGVETNIMQTSNNVAKIDPGNAPISGMSATAILIVMGTDFNDLPNRDMHGNVASISLWNNDTTAAPLDSLNADSFTHNDFLVLIGNPNASNSREYGIRFRSFNFRAFNGMETPVKAIDDVRLLRMEVYFLPQGSKIAAGGFDLVVNNTHKLFQIDTNRSEFANAGLPYLIVATNVDQPPMK